MEMTRESRNFIRSAFAEYYQSLLRLSAPPRIENREFGFLTFADRNMLRHKSFGSVGELEAFLEKTVPSDAYFSCAYYEQPEAEMDRKGWSGADLIFDIDADHIPTSCNKIHDKWTCGECGFVGRGLGPEKCPACGGQKFDIKSWPCEVCLDSAKAETIKLLDMLTRDFGFSEGEIHVFFSGHRGYHIHVEREQIREMGASARKEIVDYVRALGLDVALLGIGEKDQNRVNSSMGTDNAGWRGRIVTAVRDFVRNAKPEDYRTLGLKNNVITALVKDKEKIVESWGESKHRSHVKGVGFENWRKMMEFCLCSAAANVDTVVTTDVHRLIRLTDSLHGKTGLKKIEFPFSSIEDFDPFKSAVAFKKGTRLVLVSDSPKFRLGDGTFGPYKAQKVELPVAAAVFLICKGCAEVVEQNVQ
jgi:DNA primase small subunit